MKLSGFEIIEKSFKEKSIASVLIVVVVAAVLIADMSIYHNINNNFTISHDNIIVLSVYGNDVFAIDSMFKRILSFKEVKKTELYVFTRIEYHKEWTVREIDNRLGSKFQSTNP